MFTTKQTATVTKSALMESTETLRSTNFQPIIDLLVRLKNHGIPESDFPKAILSISHSELKCSGCYIET